MRVNAPDLNSRRARLADWLEVIALTSARQQASVSSLRSQLRLAGDDRVSAKDFDAGSEEIGEPEVAEKAADDLEERTSEELHFREKTVGASYPFNIITSDDGSHERVQLKETWRESTSGELFYVFCLLDSAIRDGMITVDNDKKTLIHDIGNMFQICACVAVGGYTNAEVVSFGFPRAKGTAFLPALQQVWQRYGSYEIIKQIPHGFDDKLKDGGVDIIAWQPFDDGHAATILMFVQVASGLDWKEKEVTADVRAIRNWFAGQQFCHFLPAICIPFPLWFDLDEPPPDDIGNPLPFSDGVVRRFAFRETKFGVIFDRGRIARSCALALGTAASRTVNIDGLDRISEVTQWVDEVMAALVEPRAAQ
jgi:hypothetical protein